MDNLESDPIGKSIAIRLSKLGGLAGYTTDLQAEKDSIEINKAP